MVISLGSGSIDTSAALLAEMDHETCRHLFNWYCLHGDGCDLLFLLLNKQMQLIPFFSNGS